MAEVLITLGIIGVVAALTLPNLIQKYQKQQAVTQLKSTYMTLAQAFEHAQADYGDVSTWGIDEIYGATSGEKDLIKSFVEKYFLPYVKPAKNYGYTKLKNIGYSGIYRLNREKDNNTLGVYRYIIALTNGAIVQFSIDGYCYGDMGIDQNGKRYCTDWRYTNVYIIADINGLKLPNTYGKDFFVMSVNTGTNKFEFYNYSDKANNRNWLLKACSAEYSNSLTNTNEDRHCGRLIQLDGWKINYNW